MQSSQVATSTRVGSRSGSVCNDQDFKQVVLATWRVTCFTRMVSAAPGHPEAGAEGFKGHQEAERSVSESYLHHLTLFSASIKIMLARLSQP